MRLIVVEGCNKEGVWGGSLTGVGLLMPGMMRSAKMGRKLRLTRVVRMG